jgi:hypothetical protein
LPAHHAWPRVPRKSSTGTIEGSQESLPFHGTARTCRVRVVDTHDRDRTSVGGFPVLFYGGSCANPVLG